MANASGSPLVIGHRGASGYRPEHTESAYRLAFELGADLVEPDIVATSDGVLVVRHENDISGTTDVAERREFADRKTTKTVDGVRLTGWFTEDFTWDELRTLRCRERLPRMRADNRAYDGAEPILRLRDVLGIVDAASDDHGRQFGVVVEVKHAHYFASIGLNLGDLLLRELASTGWDNRPDRLVIECFELGVLEWLGDAGVRAKRIFLLEREGAPADEVAEAGEDAHAYAWYRSDDGLRSLIGRVDGISVAKSDLLRTNRRGRAVGPNDLVAKAHALGLEVYTWTLRPERHFLNPRFQRGLRAGEWGDWQGEFRMILSTGVNGIFVDQPDLAVHLLEQLGHRGGNAKL
ncbi:glycerophosphodiester phosphodiesterase family protein [Leucobacter sp. GX24907]